MPIRSLSSHTALVPGAHLWIISDLEHSSWSRKLDWYLNFQITKSKLHVSPELKEDQIEEIRSWDLPFFEKPLRHENQPLMISSGEFLPNQQTVLIPFGNGVGDWITSAKKIWEDLGTPPTRFFLPDGVLQSDVTKEWQIPSSAEVSIVEPGNLR